MWDDAIKQYSQNNAKMWQDALRRQMQLYNEMITQQSQIFDNAMKQFEARNTKMLQYETNPLNKESGEVIPKKRKVQVS